MSFVLNELSENIPCSNTHQKLTKHGKCCMPNDQISSKTLVELTEILCYMTYLCQSKSWILYYMRCVHYGSSISGDLLIDLPLGCD